MYLNISIDFELLWGLYFNRNDINKYRYKIYNTKKNFEKIISVFELYKVKSTWACVAALNFNSYNEYLNNTPSEIYNLSKIDKKQIEKNANLFFFPQGVNLISKSKLIEIGSHTYNHAYHSEIRNPNLFQKDLIFSKQLIEKSINKEIKSFVYPKNLVMYPDLLTETGFHYARLGLSNPLFNSENFLLDKVSKIYNSFTSKNMSVKYNGDYSIHQTHFIRFNLPNILWLHHFKTIKKQLCQLKKGNYLSIWFHPHNLFEQSFDYLHRLEDLLKLIIEIKKIKNYEIKWMNEF